jgi:flagellar basal-body rod protein FlgB
MTEGIFNIASNHAAWASQRRLAVTANIANVNTPGYKAIDVAPFESYLNSGADGQARTDPRHLGGQRTANEVSMVEQVTAPVQHSGNSVDFEQELLKAGDVSRAHSLNTAIVRSFHRLFVNSAKA